MSAYPSLKIERSPKRQKMEQMDEIENDNIDETFVEKIINKCDAIEASNKPEAPDLAEFLSNPTSYRPKAEYLNVSFLIEEESILNHCIKSQNVGAVEALIKAGVDANVNSKKGVTPISAAAHKGNVIIMKMLVDAKSDVNAVNTTGSTALIQASHFGHLEAVDLLLKHKAAADFANFKGTTALMRASQEGHVDISKSLLTANVDVNRKNLEGMNALMLASQRGHHAIVTLLIRAAAAMDEQTAQGSTALMLACKRGHEKCAKVLVSMGAEIYMRDIRNRTARDTATRRNHHGLLSWLDTQVQVRKVQESRHDFRAAIIRDIREAYLQRKLVLNDIDDCVHRLTRAVRKSEIPGLASQEELELISMFLGSNPSLPFTAKNPEGAIKAISVAVNTESNMSELKRVRALTPSVALIAKSGKYQDWQWASLMMNCMTLPSGVFETIMDFMPLPRVWQWSLIRSKRRCKLSPIQTMMDLSVLMDEILADANIFGGADQSNLLIKLNRNPQIHPYIINTIGMPQDLLEQLCTSSDIQSMISRTTEVSVVWKKQMAQTMLELALSLYRWYKVSCSSTRHLQLVSKLPATALQGLSPKPRSNSATPPEDRVERTRGRIFDRWVIMSEGLQAGEEQTSDLDGEDDLQLLSAMITEGADQDTENEMAVEDDLDVNDSDDDAPAAPAPNHNQHNHHNNTGQHHHNHHINHHHAANQHHQFHHGNHHGSHHHHQQLQLPLPPPPATGANGNISYQNNP